MKTKQFTGESLEPTKIKGDQSSKVFKEVYGNSYDYCLQMNAVAFFVKKALEKDKENRNLKLRKVSKFDIGKYKVIPFFDFLIRKGLMDEKAKEIIIRTLKDRENFKKMIDMDQ